MTRLGKINNLGYEGKLGRKLGKLGKIGKFVSSA